MLHFRVPVRRVLLKSSLCAKDFTTSVLFHPCTREPVQFALSNGFDDRNHFSTSLTLAFQQLDGMQRIGRNIIDDAVLYYSREHQRNHLTDWLDSLQWDKTPYLDHWLSRYCGAEDNIYVRKVVRCWLLGAVTRAYQPGTQFDHCLISRGHRDPVNPQQFVFCPMVGVCRTGRIHSEGVCRSISRRGLIGRIIGTGWNEEE